MSTLPGSYDHHEYTSSRKRGKTVSGAIPDPSAAAVEQQGIVAPIETMPFPWTSPSAPTSPTEATKPSTPPAKSPGSGHRRTISGNIFSKLNFLRSNSNGGEDGSGMLRPPTRERRSGSRGEKDKEPTSPTKSLFSRKSIDDDAPQSSSSNVSPEKDRERDMDVGESGAMATALKQANKTRKRKGSLRKTALLGGKKIFNEGRERKGSFSLLQRGGNGAKQKQVTLAQREQDDGAIMDSEPESPLVDEGYEEQAAWSQVMNSTPYSTQNSEQPFTIQSSDASTTDDTSWPEPAAVSATRLALFTDHAAQTSQQGTGSRSGTMVNDLGSPLDMKSPVSQASYASTTTDDDDVLTFERPSKPSGSGVSVPPPLSSSATSYFPSVSSTSSLATRRRSSKRRSPLSRTLPLNATGSSAPYATSSASSEFGHDYTETAYWGWVLLVATWLTFTVGMGSCLELWSWAWDVGETPYAPPELEDDPTLPIVGYYPALIVLTGVVSWVWITVAWVGMKYFRHAKIEV